MLADLVAGNLMYYDINRNKVALENGNHLLYRRFSFHEKYSPEVIVIDIQDGYNARSRNEKTILNIRDQYIGIQCIDATEIEPCSEATHPEYYL